MNIRGNRTKKPGAVPPPSIQPAPPPQVKRSKSNGWRVLVLVVFAVPGWLLWDHFLRTSAYAVVEVDEILVSAPLTGLIESMSIKEDGEYEAGTTAFTIVDQETRDELEALELQLRLVESRTVEKGLDLRLSRADRLYERDENIASRRADLGKACFEQEELSAEIAKLSAEMLLKEFEVKRVEELAKQNQASEQELVAARAEYEAASKELAGLTTAQAAAISRVEALRGAIDRPVPDAPEIDAGVEPLRREADLLRRRIEQLHAKLLQRNVCLAAPGRVSRILHRPGEFVRVGDPVLVMARASTVRVVAYFDQKDASSLQLDRAVRIVSSYAPDVTGRIARLGPSLKIGPEAIARFHPKGQPLYPVEIEVDNVAMKQLVPGSLVKVFPLSRSSRIQSAYAN